MLIRQVGEFAAGYTRIAAAGGLEFGILRLRPGQAQADQAELETAWLLLAGEVRLEWEGGSAQARRSSLVEESPTVLHLSAGSRARLTGGAGGAELAGVRVANSRAFPPRLILPGEVHSALFSPPKLGSTAERVVRSAIADASAPHSNLVLGEVINRPGCWSSYPPHHHPHPEIYHYRFLPEAGFGYCEEGEQVYKVRHRDTVVLRPGLTHPQTSAPGYTMVYLWTMPHLEGNRFRDDSRDFVQEHAWLR